MHLRIWPKMAHLSRSRNCCYFYLLGSLLCSRIQSVAKSTILHSGIRSRERWRCVAARPPLTSWDAGDHWAIVWERLDRLAQRSQMAVARTDHTSLTTDRQSARLNACGPRKKLARISGPAGDMASGRGALICS